jgi:hypothetical protein
MEENRLVHHYLHNMAIGAVSCNRLNDKSLACVLPNGDAYELEVDHRDHKNIVVFDGELLHSGLPRNSTVLYIGASQIANQQTIACPSAKMRRDPEYPYVAHPQYDIVDGGKSIEVKRYFLLLPSCSAVVRKFRNDSLSPIYVIINSFYNEHGKGVVEWRTSSY